MTIFSPKYVVVIETSENKVTTVMMSSTTTLGDRHLFIVTCASDGVVTNDVINNRTRRPTCGHSDTGR